MVDLNRGLMAGQNLTAVQRAQQQFESSRGLDLFGTQRRKDKRAIAAEELEHQIGATRVAKGAAKEIGLMGGVTDDPGEAYALGQDAIDIAGGGGDPTAAFEPQTPLGQARLAREQKVRDVAASNQQRSEQLFAQGQDDRAIAQQERLSGQMKPFIQTSRGIGRTNELLTINREFGGKEVWNREALGRYDAIRKLKFRDLQKKFEAGALQQAEMDFFEGFLPPMGVWSGFSAAEKRARLEELAYTERQDLEDALMLGGQGLTMEDFDPYTTGRTWQEMNAPLKPGMSRGLTDQANMPVTQPGPGNPAPDPETAIVRYPY